MLDSVANRCAKGKQDDLCDCEESRAKYNVSNGPTILESAENEDQLRDDVNHRTDQGPEDVNDPKTERFGESETCKALERGNCNEETDTEYD